MKRKYKDWVGLSPVILLAVSAKQVGIVLHKKFSDFKPDNNLFAGFVRNRRSRGFRCIFAKRIWGGRNEFVNRFNVDCGRIINIFFYKNNNR